MCAHWFVDTVHVDAGALLQKKRMSLPQQLLPLNKPMFLFIFGSWFLSYADRPSEIRGGVFGFASERTHV